MYLIIAAMIFKFSIYNKFDGLDSDSLQLLKGFLSQKLEDAAAVLEALEVFNLFHQRGALDNTETFSVCVK